MRRRPTPRCRRTRCCSRTPPRPTTSPELEIFADDVQCGHGATSGDLDETCCSTQGARHSPKEAEALLIQAFVGEAVEGIEHAGAARRADGLCRGLARDASMTMHPAVTNGAYDVTRIREDFPILAMQVYGKPLVYLDNAASAQNQGVLDSPPSGLTPPNTPTCIAACITSPMPATEAYEDAREKVRAFLNAAAQRGDHLHPQCHRGDQPRCLYVWPRAHQAG